MQRPEVFVNTLHRNTRLLQFLLQLKRITLNAQVDVADGKSSDQIADGAAGEIEVQARVLGNVLNQVHTTLLVRCEPGFHAIDVICHLNV